MKHSVVNVVTPSPLCCLTIAFVWLVAHAACLQAKKPGGEEDFTMCEDSSDCDSGESCDEGICFGNPPLARFAAELIPPAVGGEGLALTEIPELRINPDGWAEELVFAPSVTISGRVVVACDSTAPSSCDPNVSIAAQIVARRPSQIPGRRFYTVETTSIPNVGPEKPSFTLNLPLSEDPYEIVIFPSQPASNQASDDVSAAELAPPHRFQLEVTGQEDLDSVTWVVGDPDDQVLVSGSVRDSLKTGLANIKVHAQIPSQSGRPVSSIAFTSVQGDFVLRIPQGLGSAMMDIVAEPENPSTAPTLRRTNVIPADLAEPVVLDMPSFGAPVPYVLPIEGWDEGGGMTPITAARVQATVLLSEPDAPVEALFSSTAITDERGYAVLQLLPGSQNNPRNYIVSIEPPADSEYVARFETEKIQIGSGNGGTLVSIVLDQRVPMRGSIRDFTGNEAGETSVKASLAESFLGELDARTRALVSALNLPSVLASANGRYLLWLDRDLAGHPALYDLELRPGNPFGPVWSVHDIRIDVRSEEETFEYDIDLPDASYARGDVRRPDSDDHVGNAELHLYAIDPDCTAEPGPNPACSRPLSRGEWTSRQDDGRVIIVLPKPR